MGEKIKNMFRGHKEKKKNQNGGFSYMLASFIIHKRGWIESVFVIGCLLSLLTMNFVNVNYDLTKYLPETAESAIGLDVMRDKFGYPGTARVMVKDVSLYEAKQYKDEIADIDGVDQVLWCDSTVNIYAGEDFIDESGIKDYYKDRNAVYDITFVEESDSTRTSTAIDEIKDLLGDKGCYVGMAVQNKSMTESMASEMSKILVVAVIMIFAVLSVTTTAWTEPILFLLVMGVAVLLNKGTNIFIGTVSFLTENVSIILQLATSMDYSIFLLDAFMNYRKQGMNEEDAIINAVQEAINSIFASSLTTVVGFLALVTMKFSIGFDLGLVLAKGIVFSLLTVVFFMPAMILKFAKLNEKTKHRSFMPDFHGLGKAIYRIRPIVFAVIVLVTPLAYTAQGLNDFLYGNDSMGASEGTQVYEDDQQITKIFGRSNMLLALYPNTSEVNERAMAKEIKDLSYVKNVTALADTLPEGIPEEFLPKSTVELLHKDGYCRMLIYTRTKTESAEAFKDSDAIQEIVKKYYPEGSYLVGETPSTQDIKSFIVKDYENVNVLSLAGVFLVVMMSFKSAVMPILVIIPIEVAIFINMAMPYFQGVEMVYMGYIIVSSIQLGATVDYSILLANNYLAKRKTLPKKKACVEAVAASCSSIFTSGSIITLAGYIVYMISSTTAIADLGHLIGRGGLFSLVLVLTVLPLLLTLFDNFIVGEKPAAALARRLHRRVKNQREKRRSGKNGDETEESTDEGGDPYEDDENEAAASRESEPELTDREEMEENGDETEK